MPTLRTLIIVSLYFVTGQAIALCPVPPGELSVTAEWVNKGNGQLRVSGTGIRDGSFVLSNAYPDEQGVLQVIDVANGRNGRINFKVNGKDLNPVPCRVQVDQPDVRLCGEADVVPRPTGCLPQPPLGIGDEVIARGNVYATPVSAPRPR